MYPSLCLECIINRIKPPVCSCTDGLDGDNCEIVKPGFYKETNN